jgi:hypothetical protein
VEAVVGEGESFEGEGGEFWLVVRRLLELRGGSPDALWTFKLPEPIGWLAARHEAAVSRQLLQSGEIKVVTR